MDKTHVPPLYEKNVVCHFCALSGCVAVSILERLGSFVISNSESLGSTRFDGTTYVLTNPKGRYVDYIELNYRGNLSAPEQCLAGICHDAGSHRHTLPAGAGLSGSGQAVHW